MRWCHHCNIGRTPSPFQPVTRRQTLEQKTFAPKNIFINKQTAEVPQECDTAMHHREEGINESVAQLPKCACRDRCKFPQLPRATGHHCPGCKLAIHAVCGIHDDKAGLDDSNWCYDCWEAKIHQDQQEKRPTLTSKTTRAMPSPIDNEQFPSCACRERCRFPHLPPASGHHCPGCKFSIHAVCGIHDETAGLADSNWCYSCWDSKMQQKMPAQKTSAMQVQQKKRAMATIINKTNEPPQPVAPRKRPKKSTTPAVSKQPSQRATSAMSKGTSPQLSKNATNEPTQRKSSSTCAKNLKNKIVLPKEAMAVDPFVRMKVAFHLDGPERPTWLLSNDYIAYGKEVGSRLYLLGVVLRRDKVSKTACTYCVEWEHTALGESGIDINVLQPAIELARKVQQVLDEESKHPLGPDVLHFLQANDGSAPGTAIPSDDEVQNSGESEDDEKANKPDKDDDDDDISINFAFPSLGTNGGAQPTTQQDGLLWATDRACSPNLGIYDQMKRSSIKAEMRSRFTNPLSSFLAFLPLEFWKLFVFETNRYAAMRQAQATLVDGPAINWASRLTLKELFTFLGILIQMTMRPTPGQTYTNCWQDKRWHPYTDRMPLRRFQAIRGMLHITEKGFPEESSNDALYKVRPLLNVLKKTLGDYIIPGSDLALDETSVACRSKYGRNLIFYNNTKPSGKYHFRFYALCDSDSYSCLRIVIHTRNGNDRADGYFGAEDKIINEEAVDDDCDDKANINELGKTTKLVLDIAHPFYHTGWVINMDRYYTSPEVFLEHQKQGLYARGTCMTNRRMSPKVVTFTEAEARKEKRGPCRLAVNQENNLVAIGWIDGNPVHLITTADGTEMTHVTRRVHCPTGTKATECSYCCTKIWTWNASC